ncbi:hypothetical protein [Burkholderia pseudomallei]|uniref:hypothetical protein n=1 Tax=Burkholderia pseudomallei TaxID=28450 RepID=UPI0005313A2B|nr:hypothetical protein [Burkholderia pseudomallei]KGS63056.1 hypothetical protein X990_1303 [Burkholderia pseudomallei MSHR4868]KGW22655.1 hypothetical protein Y602_915 [Burkholderia pseudomallei MSHR733]RAQ86202.1 hypothetical protein A4G85_14010 [Burkholderia pseudomallei]
MSARDDDQRAIDQVLRRRESPELAAAFARASGEVLRELGWLPTDVSETGAVLWLPPGAFSDVSAAYRPESGGLIDLRIGATSERHVDIVHLLSRLLALAASGCGRLPAESIEVRRLLVRAMAAAEGVPADDAAIDAYAASPAVSRPFEALMGVIASTDEVAR